MLGSPSKPSCRVTIKKKKKPDGLVNVSEGKAELSQLLDTTPEVSPMPSPLSQSIFSITDNSNDDDSALSEVTSEDLDRSKVVIGKIESSSIHKICSTQVIISLTSVVKELIENALDAKSTSIEIKFTNMGLDSVEVIDNGIGISANNFNNVVKKHHTSKIRSFDDIQSVTTFGFRGEALSSICCMSNLSICTKTNIDSMATLLFFDKGNALTSQETVPRSKTGTSIKVSDLFKTYPVRYKEFEKNIKREYAKCVSIIQGYALSSEGVTFICNNKMSNKENNQKVLVTHGKSLKDNIVTIFSLKEFNKLTGMNFQQDTPHYIRINGYISKPEKGCGRSSNERQFIFVNKRPVDLPKVIRCVNEVYKEFNRNQYPSFIMNIEIDPSTYDVNLTPDKRTIYLLAEPGIIELLKYELDTLFDPNKRTFSLDSSLSSVGLMFSSQSQSQDSLISTAIPPTQKTQKRPASQTLSQSPLPITPIPSFEAKSDKASSSLYDLLKEDYENEDSCSDEEIELTRNRTNKTASAKKRNNKEVNLMESSALQPQNKKTKQQVTRITFDSDTVNEMTLQPSPPITENLKNITISNSEEKSLLAKYVALKQENKKRQIGSSTIKNKINSTSKDDLTRILTKQDFPRMRVIGQFNKSFILALLDKDLYILDQHACDEKYNYERLRDTTKFNTQPLIIPQLLNLSASQKMVVTEHKELFEKNGFRIKIDQDTSDIHLLSLPHSKNITFQVNDFEELVALIDDSSALPDSMTQNIRPSKINSIFASRACRSSVMFGATLPRSKLCEIVKNLESLDQPWNCPHGRATVRALADLSSILDPSD